MKNPGYRAELVGRIILRIPMDIVIEAIVPLLSPEGNLFSQVMTVTSLTVHDFPEYPCFRHVVNHHLISSVDAVFHKHNRRLRLLIAVHEFPALGNRICTADFGCYRLSCAHRVHGNSTVRLPGGTNQHGIELFHLKHLFIVGKCHGSHSAHLFQRLCRLFSSVLIDITERDKFYIRMFRIHIFDQFRPSLSKADDAKMNLPSHSLSFPFMQALILAYFQKFRTSDSFKIFSSQRFQKLSFFSKL